LRTHSPAVLKALIIGVLLALPSSLRAGNFFQDTWDVVTDPLKLRSSSSKLADSLDRTLIQLTQLAGQANAHVQERLEQVRSILKDALDGTEQSIAKATSAMLMLEAKVNDDALNLIYTAKCAADITLKSTAEEGLASLLNQLSDARPRIRFLGITILDVQTKKLTIDNPNIAYVSAKEEALKALNGDLKDSSEARRIFFTYQTLQASAKYALCYYTLNNGPAGQKPWVSEVNDMERMLTPWTDVIQPDILYKAQK
jgi:ElaB/YqjD/DUF883 family membrane-anchored ribosome-binding protein